MNRIALIVFLASFTWIVLLSGAMLVVGLIQDNGWLIYGGLVSIVIALYWLIRLFQKLYEGNNEP